MKSDSLRVQCRLRWIIFHLCSSFSSCIHPELHREPSHFSRLTYNSKQQNLHRINRKVRIINNSVIRFHQRTRIQNHSVICIEYSISNGSDQANDHQSSEILSWRQTTLINNSLMSSDKQANSSLEPWTEVIDQSELDKLFVKPRWCFRI